jgi:hypothetical protein
LLALGVSVTRLVALEVFFFFLVFVVSAVGIGSSWKEKE